MAKFHEKVLCLFSKNTQQIEKEAQRRGISTYTKVNGCKSREHMIAEIIYKDAFDCGRSEASQTCPNGCKGKPEVENYFLHINEIDNPTFNVALTDEQVAFFEWLVEEEILDSGLVSLEPASRIINVGRIE
jgi:hypothetical protein